MNVQEISSPFKSPDTSNRRHGDEVNTSRDEDFRVRIQLPVRGECRANLESIGVEWAQCIEGNQFAALGKLPKGWSFVRMPHENLDMEEIALLDIDNNPRAKIVMKTAAYQQRGFVILLNQEQALELKNKIYGKNDTEKEFLRLLRQYQYAVQNSASSYPNMQQPVDQAWKVLQEFSVRHPQFKDRVPEKRLVDNQAGLNSNIMLLVNHYCMNK